MEFEWMHVVDWNFQLIMLNILCVSIAEKAPETLSVCYENYQKIHWNSNTKLFEYVLADKIEKTACGTISHI